MEQSQNQDIISQDNEDLLLMAQEITIIQEELNFKENEQQIADVLTTPLIQDGDRWIRSSVKANWECLPHVATGNGNV